MDLNSPPSPYPLHHQIYDIDHDRQLQLIPFGSSSSSSFFSSPYDHHYQGLPRQDQYRTDAFGDGYSSYEIKKRADSSDLKLSLGKKFFFEDQVQESTTPTPRKIKNAATTRDRVSVKIVRSGNKEIEDRKLQRRSYSPPPSSSSSEVYEPSNESPPLYSNHMTMSPVRVCTDCNTTKTPLWRSGPKGPKSLCNACGIRQRKARRAMAAAAAGGMSNSAAKQAISMKKKKKMHCKERASKNNDQISPSPHLKKRLFNKSSTAAADRTSSVIGPSNSQQKKIGIEDFLMNLSNNLANHRVFPEDDKDAAILLMAISYGLVHG